MAWLGLSGADQVGTRRMARRAWSRVQPVATSESNSSPLVALSAWAYSRANFLVISRRADIDSSDSQPVSQPPPGPLWAPAVADIPMSGIRRPIRTS